MRRGAAENPQARTVDYEYWTCTTLAPGSDANNPKATGGRNRRADPSTRRRPGQRICPRAMRAQGQAEPFRKIALLQNWPTMVSRTRRPICRAGVRGVISHDNEEGSSASPTIRCPGLKMWTWGFPSFCERNRRTQGSERSAALRRVVGRRVRTSFPPRAASARGEVSIPETYSPTVGMSNVTAANENILINFSAGHRE